MLGTRRCRLLTADLFLLFHSILAPRHSTLPRSGPQSAISPIDLPPAHCYTHSPEGGPTGTVAVFGHSEGFREVGPETHARVLEPDEYEPKGLQEVRQ